MVFDSKRERVLTKNERVELRHFLQVLMEHSRTVRNAIEPDSGRLRITAEAWADQWLALRKDLDALTEQILPGSTVRRVRLPVRRETAVVEREAAGGRLWLADRLRGHLPGIRPGQAVPLADRPRGADAAHAGERRPGAPGAGRDHPAGALGAGQEGLTQVKPSY
jgi:hypothetical protein